MTASSWEWPPLHTAAWPPACPLSTSASSAHEPLHSLPSYINYVYAAVASDCHIVGYAELTVIIAETAETGEDPAAQINLHSAGSIEAAP